MSAFTAVFLRELLILKHRFKRQISGMAVSPLLYMLTFGFALGSHLKMGEHSYLEFLVPGLLAMSSMTQAFAIASDINVSRFYFFVFEEIMAAPTSRLAYVLGEVCSGLLRVLLASAVIIILASVFGVKLHYSPTLWLAIFLNAFSFSALAVAMAMLVRSHADQSLLNSFIITPMAFLGGTFFPLDSLPAWAQGVLSVLPLTHAAKAVRAEALGGSAEPISLIILSATSILFLLLAISTVTKAKD